MQWFRVGYRRICHPSLVFSVYIQALTRFGVNEENTSDKWHVLRYPNRKHCITTLSHVSGEKKTMSQNVRDYTFYLGNDLMLNSEL